MNETRLAPAVLAEDMRALADALDGLDSAAGILRQSADQLDGLAIADELEFWAAHFASLATDSYPESVFPPPKLGETSTPDAYTAAGYRNAYRNVAADLRARAADLRAGVDR